MRRTVLALAGAAATAAASAALVAALAFAIYAGAVDAGARDWAAALLVALAAACAVGLAALAAGRRAHSGELAPMSAQSAPVEPAPAFAPLGLFADALRHRPILSLALTVGAGVLAARQPALMRELAALFGQPSPRDRD